MKIEKKKLSHLPPIYSSEDTLAKITKPGVGPVFLNESPIDFSSTTSTCAIALHMHQPLIPAGKQDLTHASVISNLQHMLLSEDSGEQYNATIFSECYGRMSTYITDCVDRGLEPRVMLDYSGTLLYGLQQMGKWETLEKLVGITTSKPYRHCVEWLGTAWGHAVAPSTPPQDFRIHVRAWQSHFLSIFGEEALSRVKGFSPPEMALPNHPDIAFEFINTLKSCGYTWILVQEHTIEDPETGDSIRYRHLPHLLVCKNSAGEETSIVILIKTQGSDTKLVAQMQPWFEAKTLSKQTLAGRLVPPIVSQIADGENGGVMMNEFPNKYLSVVEESSATPFPLINGTEYLEHLFSIGIKESDLPRAQPIKQHALWNKVPPGCGPEKLGHAIEELSKYDHRFHMEGGSWTSHMSWVRGYEKLLKPMEELSAHFHEAIRSESLSPESEEYQEALFYLLTSQTSCFRYWGEGIWADYGRELCRRGLSLV